MSHIFEKPAQYGTRQFGKFTVLTTFFIIAFFGNLLAQTPGLIYKPATSVLGRSVLDPNGDGFVSLTTAGFSGTDYGSASELKMITLPILGIEPTGDLTTGASGGHTDIVNNGVSANQSCYILYKTVGGVDYLIIRFRIGSASTSAKGYSFLLDTDGVFGTLLSPAILVLIKRLYWKLVIPEKFLFTPILQAEQHFPMLMRLMNTTSVLLP